MINAKFDSFCYNVIQPGKITEDFLPNSQNLDSKFTNEMKTENIIYSTEISHFSVLALKIKILKTWKVTKGNFVSDPVKLRKSLKVYVIMNCDWTYLWFGFVDLPSVHCKVGKCPFLYLFFLKWFGMIFDLLHKSNGFSWLLLNRSATAFSSHKFAKHGEMSKLWGKTYVIYLNDDVMPFVLV